MCKEAFAAFKRFNLPTISLKYGSLVMYHLYGSKRRQFPTTNHQINPSKFWDELGLSSDALMFGL